jgi:hypothetical protein
VNGHWRALVLLVTVASAVGLDLTSFRPSYQHERRLDWDVAFSALLSDDRYDTILNSRSELSLRPVVTFRDQILADDLDWNAVIDLAPLVQVNSERDDESRGSYSLALRPELARSSYLFGSSLFIRTDFAGKASWTEGRESHVSGNVPWRQVSTTLSANGGAKIGLGVGHVRDAWPLLKATRVVELLRSEGVLRSEPSDADLTQLAAFFSRSWRFAYAHDRAERFYYDSLTTRLRELGVISGALPARSLFRLDEELFVGSYARPFGWKVSAYVHPGADGSVNWWTSSLGYSDTGRSGHSSLRYGAEAEYDRPFGRNWLVTTWATYLFDPGESTWTIVPDVHRITADASVSWQAFNRLAFHWGLRTNIEHLRFDFVRRQPVTSLQIWSGPSMEYFLAELLYLRVGLGAYVNRSWSPEPIPWTYGTQLSAGLDLGRTLHSRY